jgi:ABC-type nitrate/sulfonate/bicarbonate transport system permease component
VTGVLVLLLLWEMLGRQANPLLFVPPSVVFSAMGAMIRSGELLTALWISLQEFVAGFVAAAAIGVMLGWTMGISRFFADLLDPLVNFLYAVPRIAFIPLIVLWFGLEFQAKVAFVVLLSAVPITITVYASVHEVPREYSDLVRVMGGSRSDVLRTVVIPGTIPGLLTALQLGGGAAILGTILAEMFTALTGLGGLLVTSASRFQTDRVFAVVLVIGLVAVLLTGLLRFGARLAAPWAASNR